MERALIVLYSKGNGEQSWCMYYGGTEEANREYECMLKSDPERTERGRIWITTTAKVVFWAGPAE
jgi:hypothetical protein